MDIKQLEADFQNYIDSCNKLRNSANAILQTEMIEDTEATNDFPLKYLVHRARYIDNLANIRGCARLVRDETYTKSMRQSLQEIKEYLSVTAK